MNRYKAIFNENQIKYDTGRALLIKAPNSRRNIWIPSSIISRIKGRRVFAIIDDFSYHTDKGESLTANQVMDLFENNIMSITYHKPEKLEAKHVEADDSLKR